MDEKQKKKILIAVGLVVVVGILSYFLVFSGKGGAEQAAGEEEGDGGGGRRITVVGTPTAAPTKPAAPGAAATPTTSPGTSPGAPAAPGAQPAQPGTKVATAPAKPAIPPYRPDPFAPLRPPPKAPPKPKPPPLVFQVGIPPVRIQRRGDTPFGPSTSPAAQAETLPRLVGVMYDGKAWALLEIGGRSTIVKPGDTFVGGRVQSIGVDTVVIRTDKQEEKTLTLTGIARPPVADTPTPATGTVSPSPAGGAPAFPMPSRPGRNLLRLN